VTIYQLFNGGLTEVSAVSDSDVQCGSEGPGNFVKPTRRQGHSERDFIRAESRKLLRYRHLRRV